MLLTDDELTLCPPGRPLGRFGYLISGIYHFEGIGKKGLPENRFSVLSVFSGLSNRQGWSRKKYFLCRPSRLHFTCLEPLALALPSHSEEIFFSTESAAALDRCTEKIAC